jgi:hypothetical protein
VTAPGGAGRCPSCDSRSLLHRQAKEGGVARRRMTCSSATGCSCSTWPGGSVSRPLAAVWASTIRPTIAGGADRASRPRAAALGRCASVRGKHGRPAAVHGACSATAPATPAATAASCARGISAKSAGRRSRRVRARPRTLGRRAHDLLVALIPRLRVRYERRADVHEAFLRIAGCLICLKLLQAEESIC